MITRRGLLSALLTAPFLRGASREQSIQSLRATLEREHQGKGWEAWHASLQPFREQWRQTLSKAEASPLPSTEPNQAPKAMVAARSLPGYYCPVLHVEHVGLYRRPPEMALGEWATAHPAVAAIRTIDRWLRAQGIELIFVPAPRYGDLYPEDLLAAGACGELCGPQPHMRHLLHTLAVQDIEVIDLLPSLQRDPSPRFPAKFIAGDTHWSYRAHEMAGAAVAERLKRTPWVAAAQARPRRFAMGSAAHESPAPLLGHLTPEERERIAPLRRMQVPLVNGFVSQPDAPILVTGDSFVNFGVPLAATLAAHVAQKTNLPVTVEHIDGNVVQNFQAMFRDPELLRGKKAVVWIMNYTWLAIEGHWPRNLATPQRSKARGIR